MPPDPSDRSAVGRGARSIPTGRFEKVRREDDVEHLSEDDALAPRRLATEFLPDVAQSIVSENDSPDIPFRFSINPYRGCEHGCSYCYARPTHEYLGLSGGFDFETKIFVKHQAPQLLREWLMRGGGGGERVTMSGVTDCYQPVERELQITRGCLQVLAEAGQAVTIVTKNALVARDIDLLAPLAARRLIQVRISLTTLDAELSRSMEPRTSTPAAKLRAIRQLVEAGIPTGILMAPIIPGLTDSQIPQVLEAAHQAGAQSASYTMLRLPGVVESVFLQWLEAERPGDASRILAGVKAVRGGKLYDARFGSRMKGEGPIAEQIRSTFKVFARKYGLHQPLAGLDEGQFEPPERDPRQKRLF